MKFFGIRSIVLLVCLFSTSYLTAADIAHDVRSTETPLHTKSESSRFIEIGLKASTKRNPIEVDGDHAGFSLLLDGSFQWKGLFIEVIEDSSTLFTAGYNAWNNNHWSLDIVVSQIYDDVIDYNGFKKIEILEGEPPNVEEDLSNESLDEIQSSIDDATTETSLVTAETIVSRFKNLRDSNSGFLIGSRATAYYGNYIFQFGLLTDISDRRNDTVASIEAGRSWQIRNWNLYTLGRARYNTSRVAIYYLNFDDLNNESEKSYSKNKASILALKVGATHPLTEDWLFRCSLEYKTLSESFFQGPMTKTRFGTSLSTSISYVF